LILKVHAGFGMCREFTVLVDLMEIEIEQIKMAEKKQIIRLAAYDH
jgi:hypothetical protein